jgi:hypothetical protein
MVTDNRIAALNFGYFDKTHHVKTM